MFNILNARHLNIFTRYIKKKKKRNKNIYIKKSNFFSSLLIHLFLNQLFSTFDIHHANICDLEVFGQENISHLSFLKSLDYRRTSKQKHQTS